MVSTVPAEALLHSARVAAGRQDVRRAVRDLALHALRGHLLTAAHVAVVARTVGEGVRSSEAAREAAGRETLQGAWAGLEDAVGQALDALELAIREAAEGRTPVSVEERERSRAELAQLKRSLGEGWDSSHQVSGALASRFAAVQSLFAQFESAVPPEAAGKPAAWNTGEALAVLASGIFLGLSEAARRPAPANAR